VISSQRFGAAELMVWAEIPCFTDIKRLSHPRRADLKITTAKWLLSPSS
jgi:hypothetical protein